MRTQINSRLEKGLSFGVASEHDHRAARRDVDGEIADARDARARARRRRAADTDLRALAAHRDLQLIRRCRRGNWRDRERDAACFRLCATIHDVEARVDDVFDDADRRRGEQQLFSAEQLAAETERELVDGFRAGKVPDPMTDIRYYNIKTMQALNLK